MITEVGAAVGRAVVERAGRLWSQFHEASPLNSDVFESDEAYLVVFDVPGATHGDVQVRYVDGDVLVRLDRFREVHEGFEMVFPGRGMALDGRAALPENADVDAEAATATLTSRGTLEVHVPKLDGPDGTGGLEGSDVDEGGTDGDDARDVGTGSAGAGGDEANGDEVPPAEDDA